MNIQQLKKRAEQLQALHNMTGASEVVKRLQAGRNRKSPEPRVLIVTEENMHDPLLRRIAQGKLQAGERAYIQAPSWLDIDQWLNFKGDQRNEPHHQTTDYPE